MLAAPVWWGGGGSGGGGGGSPLISLPVPLGCAFLLRAGVTR